MSTSFTLSQQHPTTESATPDPEEPRTRPQQQARIPPRAPKAPTPIGCSRF
jgi:hypothetical protein